MICIKEVETLLRRSPSGIASSIFGFLRDFNFEHQLHEIKCNTLILVGEEDWITDKKHSQMMADSILESKLIIFPKSDHSMESDVPDLFFKAIRDFVSLEPKNDFDHRFFKSNAEELIKQNSNSRDENYTMNNSFTNSR